MTFNWMRLIWCAIAGAVTTILVVAYIAFVPPERNPATVPTWTWYDSANDRPWALGIERRPGMVSVRADGMARHTRTGYFGDAATEEFPADIPGWSVVHGPMTTGADHDRVMIREFAVGWPLVAMRFHVVWLHDDTDPTKSRRIVHGAWSYPTTAPGDIAGDHLPMPLIPVCGGFALNSLLYGAVWFALVSLWTNVRRRQRLKRGCCPVCDYDLRFQMEGGCPECGWRRALAAHQSPV